MGCASSAETNLQSPPNANAPSAQTKEKLPPILFIRLDKLLAQSEVPRLGISPAQRRRLGYGAKENITDRAVKETLVQDWRNLYLCVGDDHFPTTDFLVELDDIDMETSVVGFVSHCWLRGWSGAPGYQDRPHPDDAQHSKHRLTKEALTKLQLIQFNGCKECYVWIDYTCINQDANPAAELKQLDLIIKSCDFVLTPIQDDKDGSWVLSLTYDGYYHDYKAEAWQKYLNRGWCLVEMMYAANVPLKDNAASQSRLSMINGLALKSGLNRGHRAHFLYGTRESRGQQSPISLDPLQNSFFDAYNPIAHGEVSSPEDKAKIVELVCQLQPYIEARNARVGYVGDLDSNGVPCGHGTHVSANGDVYEGEFKSGTGLRHGYGKYVWANGDVYEGEFEDDVPSGRGTRVHAIGDAYEGEFKDGLCNGNGRYTYADGSRVYEGEFKDGSSCGRGRLVWADGRVQEGRWRGDEFLG